MYNTMQGKAALVHGLMQGVQARFGIHPSPHVERKLNRIFEPIQECELRAWVEQLEALPHSDGEWLSLVESLTVHETYFGRDQPMLQMLRDSILPMLLARKKNGGLFRIWSAGCSTGEETTNLSILLLQAMERSKEATRTVAGEIIPLPDWQLEVLGTDVSRQAITSSRNARYADNAMGSFRNFCTEELKQFFERVNEVPEAVPGVAYYQARNFVRRWLKFQQHNLLSGKPAAQGCDLVICRNVLIYFEDRVKRLVQQLFYQALAPGGVLVLGGPDVQYLPECYERRSGNGGIWYIRKV